MGNVFCSCVHPSADAGMFSKSIQFSVFSSGVRLSFVFLVLLPRTKMFLYP
jgi:hypothetical protein